MTTAPATHRRRRIPGSEEGATAVEAALVLSAFLGMLLVIVDFAQAFFIWNTLQLVVGQASRYVIVQNGIPGSSCDTTCANTALQTAISSASICTTPTAGQYCVNATCNPSSCSSTTSTPIMTLSALYGYNFGGLYTSTLTGQITVPIGLRPDYLPPD
jgi:Flp pilus assembly protein TadG